MLTVTVTLIMSLIAIHSMIGLMAAIELVLSSTMVAVTVTLLAGVQLVNQPKTDW